MKRIVCCVIVLMLAIGGVIFYYNSFWTELARNGVRVEWDDPWVFDGETLYYCEVLDTDNTVLSAWLNKDTCETIIAARKKGLIVFPAN